MSQEWKTLPQNFSPNTQLRNEINIFAIAQRALNFHINVKAVCLGPWQERE
jgi:hypothetical protein